MLNAKPEMYYRFVKAGRTTRAVNNFKGRNLAYKPPFLWLSRQILSHTWKKIMRHPSSLPRLKEYHRREDGKHTRTGGSHFVQQFP